MSIGVHLAISTKRTPALVAALLIALGISLSIARVSRAAVPPPAPSSKSEKIPDAPGMPSFAWVVGIENLPADSLGRSQFLSGFESVFTDRTFRTEKASVAGDEWLPAIPVTNRFHLLHGTSGEGAWQVQVMLDWEPPRPVKGGSIPVSRGLDSLALSSTRMLAEPLQVRVTAVTQSQDMIEAGARPLPRRTLLSVTTPREPRGPFARSLGRSVGLLVLEQLHQLSEEMPQNERVRLDGAIREPVPARPSR